MKVGVDVFAGSKVAVLVGKEVAVLAGKGVAVLVDAGTIVLVGKGVSEGATTAPEVAEGLTRVGEKTGIGVFVTGSTVAVRGTAAVSVGSKTGVWVADTGGALAGAEVSTIVEVGTEAKVGVAEAWLGDTGV